MGSDGGKDDIYPRQQVGVGEHGGKVALSSGGLKIIAGNETVTSNDTDTGHRRRKRDLNGNFLMEPGRWDTILHYVTTVYLLIRQLSMHVSASPLPTPRFVLSSLSLFSSVEI